MDEVLQLLPDTIRSLIETLPPIKLDQVEEIRIRIDRPLEVTMSDRPYYPKQNGERYVVTREDALQFLNKLSDFSLYALEEELKRGYIAVRGGHRVGLAGKVIVDKGQVKAIKEIGSYNIRIAKQQIGVSHSFLPYLYTDRWLNTLIIGSPQTGKTTLLRDLARVISSGYKELNILPAKVGIVDERSEIAGCVKGVPQHQLGERVDVLDACPKAEGMMMMIRSMSPDVLIVDEIGRKEDSEAIIEAMNAGVQMIMTVHGHSLQDLYKRPMLRNLLSIGIFDRYIELIRKQVPGVVKQIRDHDGKSIFSLERVEQR